MFTLINPPQIVPVKIVKSKSSHRIYPQHTNKSEDLLTLNIDLILENEKQYNKTETWNKLDKTFKMQKLTLFAEKFISENPNIDTTVDSLISFFNNCLNDKKLQKKKDLVYDKKTYEIIEIPSLHYNTINHSFSLKNLDTKRISTLKYLTPKRNTEKHKE
jgi:hypothetical protein